MYINTPAKCYLYWSLIFSNKWNTEIVTKLYRVFSVSLVVLTIHFYPHLHDQQEVVTIIVYRR